MAHIVSCVLRISTLTRLPRRVISGYGLLPSSADVSSAATAAAAQAAYVYVGTTKGVYLYNAASNGSLSLVSGSPFSIAGSAVGSNGKYFFSLGPSFLRSYPVASNGAIKGQASQINTQLYSGSECGTEKGAVLDHTGQNVMCNSTVTRREGPGAMRDAPELQTFQYRSALLPGRNRVRNRGPIRHRGFRHPNQAKRKWQLCVQCVL